MRDPIREIVPDIKQALEAAGYVIVPAEPTPEMMRAGVAAMDPEIFRQWNGDNMSAVFTAMIRAAQGEDDD